MTLLENIKSNPWFFLGLIFVVLIGFAAVYALGFWELVQLTSTTQERLRNVTFPVWDAHSFNQHGFLTFLRPGDFENAIAYSNHSSLYLIVMYLFFKLEVFFPILQMRATSATLVMLSILSVIVYIIFSSKQRKINFVHGLLILLSIAVFVTNPWFWISAAKYNVDNPFTFQFAFILIVAYQISRGEIRVLHLWLPVFFLLLFAPFTSALIGTYLIFDSVINSNRKENLKLGLVVICLSIIVYLEPVLVSKFLGFSSLNSSWMFRSGLDGDTRYFKNALYSVLFPVDARPSISFVLLPFSMIFIQSILMVISLKSANLSSGEYFDLHGFKLDLFVGIVFSSYIISLLLWPQAISIHPYLYDFMLVGPLWTMFILNFAVFGFFSGWARFWIVIMLFIVFYNLQQIAQAAG